MSLLERLSLQALSLAAPPEHRAALIGDLLEERELRRTEGEPAIQTERWIAQQAAASLPALLLLRVQRLGAARGSLAAAAAAVTAAATQMGEAAAWRQVLSQVPLRADHPPPLGWQMFALLLQCIAAAATARLCLQLTRVPRNRDHGGGS